MQEHGESYSAVKTSKAQEHEMLSESPKVIQLVSGRARIYTQVCLILSSVFFPGGLVLIPEVGWIDWKLRKEVSLQERNGRIQGGEMEAHFLSS